MSDTIKTSEASLSERGLPDRVQSEKAPPRHGRDRQLDLELTRLSKRIDELVTTLETLKEENRALRQRHESLANERATLLQKNEQVRTRVEAMIGRLKTLEHGV
jgi:cell division protein ZapB